MWNSITDSYYVGPSFSLVGKGVQLGVNERPVAANMDQEGITSTNPYGVTEVGVYTPDGTGSGQSSAQWYWFLAGNAAVPSSMSWLTNQTNFVAAPLGPDEYVANFGNTYALPVVGRFDPPVSSSAHPSPYRVCPRPAN